MRIECLVLAKKKPDLQLALDAANLRADFIALFQVMLPDEFFRDGDCAVRPEPALNIKLAGIEIRWVEGAERRVGENVDPKQLEVITLKIRQRDEPFHDWRRGGNARYGYNLRPDCLRQGAGRGRHF